MLPAMPAVRLFADLSFTLHIHPHPPTFGIPIPAIGPCVVAGAWSVLINGLPSVRTGDLGFSAWCGGYFPLFEVITGSSHCFIAGARPARVTDFTLHCTKSPNITRFQVGMMMFNAAMGVIGLLAAGTDLENAVAEDNAAMAAAASTEAAVAGAQLAADATAMALSLMAGMDPAIPPAIGVFITGSPNVLIGGFPMPGWTLIVKGLFKVLRLIARAVQLLLPEGSKLRNALCAVTGHPVDVATGRVFTSQTDFFLAGRIPIQFTRAYDTSSVDYEGTLGHGWIHPYDIHLWEDREQGMVILRNEEARLVGFAAIEVGGRTFNPLEHIWLERPAEGVYVIRGRDQLRYRFSPVPGADNGVSEAGHSEANALRLTSIEDRNENRATLTYENGRLNSIEDSVGSRIVFNYMTLASGAVRLADVRLVLDSIAHRTARLANYIYDAEGNLISATDRGLVPWRYSYDRHTLVRETNRNGLSFHFEYEGEAARARCIHTWGDGGIYERWITYDPSAQMSVVRDSLGGRTTYNFNDLDLPVSIVDSLGGKTVYTYGPFGQLLSETDQAGRTTKYNYDERGNRTRVIRPDQSIREVTYDENDLPKRLVDEAGSIFEREYNERGNLIATIDPIGNRRTFDYNLGGDIIEAADPLGGVTRLEWNEQGRLVRWVTPEGSVTRYGYDARGRLATVTDPLGNQTHYEYNAQAWLLRIRRPDGGVRQNEYDPEGNIIRFIDGNGRQTIFRFQGLNRLAERIDGAGFKRRFIYDADERVIEIHNERGEIYYAERDLLGRVVREIAFDKRSWTYEYDATGFLLSRADSSGRISRFTRDQRGQVVRRLRPDGAENSFSYDPLGRLLEAHTPESHLTFEYDKLGRVVSESQNGRVIEHEYDALGQRVIRRSPSGVAVEYAYDSDGRLNKLQTPGGMLEVEYDPGSHIISRKLPGDIQEARFYDKCGRVTRQSVNKKGDAVFSRAYKYDADGNLIELYDSAKGENRFAYDGVENLREVMQPESGAEQFVFDSTGNLLQRNGKRFDYSVGNRLIQQDDASLKYDSAGNLIEKRRGDSVIRYKYDSDDRLISVESQEGGRIEFSYDALGRRLAKRDREGEVQFLWDGDVLLAETRGDTLVEYVFKPGGFEPLCRLNNGAFETYHTDHLGTPRELTDARGRVVWSASYDVYGRIDQLHVAESENPLRFKGQYEDRDTGLHYNRFRYYDPDLCRYITQDPIGLTGGLNPYRYLRNPINWVDPLGLADPLEIGTYGSLNGGDHVGDDLEAHELIRHAYLQQQKKAGRRRGRKNPSIALTEAQHDNVHGHEADIREERGLGRLGLSGDIQTELDITTEALRRAGIPEEKIQELRERAEQHATKIGCT
jgi:RHS repeat-associated protein